MIATCIKEGKDYRKLDITLGKKYVVLKRVAKRAKTLLLIEDDVKKIRLYDSRYFDVRGIKDDGNQNAV